MSRETIKFRAWPVLLMGMVAVVCPSQRGPRNLSPDPYDVQQKLSDRLSQVELATKPISIAEMEKLLANQQHPSDKKLAALLSAYSLTERVTSARLSRWSAAYPGSKTRQALTALADGSAFDPLPLEDTSAAPVPPLAEQRKMMDQMGLYLKEALPSLPNLVATRHTIYFEDHPPRQILSTSPDDSKRNWPVHLIGTSNSQVSYVDGHEVIRKNEGFTGYDPFATRLSTTGEFGAILYGVILDAANSNLAWVGWQKTDTGLLAVYRFDAPREKSHFALRSHDPHKSADQTVPYRGVTTLNPADGSIVRLVLMAQLSQADSLAEADIAVEYGQVEIGQHLYTCPIHGVAVSKIPLRRPPDINENQSVVLQTEINDVIFEQYHIFRGDSRILVDAEARP